MTAATDSPPSLSAGEREALEAVAKSDLPVADLADAILNTVDEQSYDREG